MTAPFPNAMEYDPDTRAITCKGAMVARVYEADDFPCLSEHEGEQVGQELDATAEKLVNAYNSADALIGILLEVNMLLACLRNHERSGQAVDLDGVRRLAGELAVKLEPLRPLFCEMP